MDNITQLIDQLKTSPEFNHFLCEKFKNIATTGNSVMVRPQRRSSQTNTVGDLVDQVAETVGSLIQLHLSETIEQVQALSQTVKGLQKEVEEKILTAIEQLKCEQIKIVESLKGEMREQKEKEGTKSSALAFGFQALLAKMKSLEDGRAKINLDEKLFSSSCIEDRILEDTKSKLVEKSVEDIERSMVDMEARLQEKYQTNMNSIWKVVVQLEKRYQQSEAENQLKHMNKTVAQGEPRKRRFGWIV